MKEKTWILENGMYVSWAIALIAMLGSLYFSEIIGYFPCKLCWYQRICMYPLVLIIGVGAVRKDYGLSKIILPMTIIGGCISIYHYLVQKTGWFAEGGSTCGLIPCNVQYINWLGFITIPFLALIAFVAVSILQIGIIRAQKRA